MSAFEGKADIKNMRAARLLLAQSEIRAPLDASDVAAIFSL
jgi:hypothetical protein